MLIRQGRGHVKVVVQEDLFMMLPVLHEDKAYRVYVLVWIVLFCPIGSGDSLFLEE